MPQVLRASGDETDAPVVDLESADPTSIEYDMSHVQRGHVIIINNKNFGSTMPVRKGTDLDAGGLYQKLRILGFDQKNINLMTNQTALQMENIVIRAAKSDHSNCDCFVLILLSHGDEKGVYGVDSKPLEVDNLMKPFAADKCPSLAGKPKIFIIQACRGREFQEGVRLQTDAQEGAQDDEDVPDASSLARIPIYADFLLSYSTIPGYYSWRNQNLGSWYVQALTTAIEHWGDRLEFVRLLTHVNYLVSRNFESSTGDLATSKKKQVPCFNSMLTKQLFFRPK